jgi:hypothetical protein
MVYVTVTCCGLSHCPGTVTIQITVRSQPYSEAEPKILFHIVTNLFHPAGPLD